MKRSLLLLRLCGLLFLCSSASVAEAKECVGDLFVFLKQADGTLVEIQSNDPNTLDYPEYSATLSSGDTVVFWQWVTGYCYGMSAGLCIHGVLPGDTADQSSPIINVAAGSAMLAQSGSYFIEQYGVDWGMAIRLFVDAPQQPQALGLLFTKPSNYYSPTPFVLGSVPAGDTCEGPCFNAYLNDGQSLRMQAIHGDLAQAGGNAVVRFAPDGEPLSFDSPADTVLMVGFEGYQFSEDGLYLLSVEGPTITGTGYAYVHVSHGNIPYIDLQVAKKGSDGSMSSLTTASAMGPAPCIDMELAFGDSILFRYLVDQAPCSGIRLKAYRSDGDTATTQDVLFLDLPVDPQWSTFRATGALLLTLEDTCGAITASAHLSVSEAISTGIRTLSQSGFNAFYANDRLLVDSETGGQLELRNLAGQLLRTEQVAKGAKQLAIPFNGQADGVYIATLRSAEKVDVIRFAVY